MPKTSAPLHFPCVVVTAQFATAPNDSPKSPNQNMNEPGFHSISPFIVSRPERLDFGPRPVVIESLNLTDRIIINAIIKAQLRCNQMGQLGDMEVETETTLRGDYETPV